MEYKILNEKIVVNFEFGELPISPDEKNGYKPIQLFVSSLIGCSGSILRDILHKKRYQFEKLEMEASIERNPFKANRIEKLNIVANVVSESVLSSEQAEKIANLVIKNCGMIQSVIESIDITFDIKYFDPNGDQI